MPSRTLVEAVNDALHVEMERDESVMVMGEDVGRAGGVFRATAGLLDRLSDRCRHPLAEAGILGTAVGSRWPAGGRSARCSTSPSATPASTSSSATSAATAGGRTGRWSFRITIRMPTGGGVKARSSTRTRRRPTTCTPRGSRSRSRRRPPTRRAAGGGHPLAGPGRPHGAEGALPQPPRGRARRRAHRLGARIAREGDDVTLIAYGGMVAVAERAADELEASAEVVDVRTLKPLDEETLLASVAKTGRAVIVQEAPRVAGFGAEMAALLAEKAILDLRGPVLRVTGYDVPSLLVARGRAHPRRLRASSRPSTRLSFCGPARRHPAVF